MMNHSTLIRAALAGLITLLLAGALFAGDLDGTWTVTFDTEGARISGKEQSGRVIVDGSGLGDVEDIVSDERTRLGGHERITLQAAVEAYTAGSAYVNRLDRTTGSIAPGRAADLVVADRDIFAGGAQLPGTKVDLTMIGGEVVYERG